MLTVLSLTAPIFLLIALGYACVARGLFSPEALAGMGRFVLILALPALLFRSLVQQRIGDLIEPGYLIVYALGSLIMLLGGFFYARRVHGLGTTSSAFRGLGMSASNSGFVGLPLALQVLGPQAAVPAALTFLVENLLILPLLLALAEGGAAEHPSGRAMAKSIASSLIRSPLVLSIVAACMGLGLGVQPSGVAAKLIDLLAASSAPVALVVIGGTLYGLSARGMVRPVLEVVTGKLILHPLTMFLLLLVIPVAAADMRHAAILFASTPMLGIYPVLAQRYGDEKFCAAAQLVTTACAFFTISTILWLLQSGWLPV